MKRMKELAKSMELEKDPRIMKIVDFVLDLFFGPIFISTKDLEQLERFLSNDFELGEII